jgi:hypothetical protein
VGATPSNALFSQTNNMPARRTKTKIGAKKAAKKTKVVIPNFDGIIKETLSPVDIIEPDSFQEYAPPEDVVVKVQTKTGTISLSESDKQDNGLESFNNSDEELEAVIEVKSKVHAVAPLKQVKPTLGSGSPLNASEAKVGYLPEDAAKTVEKLINGLNYLYSLVVEIKGHRGLKEHDEPILRETVKRGRDLIASLSN